MDHYAKAKRIDRVENDTDEQYVLEQFPEIHGLSEEHQELVLDGFTNYVPEYFWTIPSSSRGKYHSDDACGEYGNVLHTKRVMTVFERLARSWTEQGLITEYEQELGRVAVLFHDAWKNGWPSENNDHTVQYHDVIGAAVTDVLMDVDERVSGAIAAHNGSWGEGPSPSTELQQLVHNADMVAADDAVDIAVLEPSEELLSIRDDLPTIELD